MHVNGRRAKPAGPTVRKRTTRRLATLMISFAAIAAGGVFGATSASAATGGGCNNNLTVRSCISYNGSTWSVVADSYFYQTPPSGCTHTTTIYDGYGDAVAWQKWNYCNNGWNPGVGVGTWSGDYIGYSCYYNGSGRLIACAYSAWQHV